MLIFLGVCISLLIIGTMVFDASECEAKGGVYVETVFSYECVKVVPR